MDQEGGVGKGRDRKEEEKGRGMPPALAPIDRSVALGNNLYVRDQATDHILNRCTGVHAVF